MRSFARVEIKDVFPGELLDLSDANGVQLVQIFNIPACRLEAALVELSEKHVGQGRDDVKMFSKR